MPGSELTHSPPPWPPMDDIARHVQILLEALKLNMDAAAKGNPWPFPDSYRPGFSVRRPITLWFIN